MDEKIPATYEEYLKKFNANQRIEGFGPEGVTMHMPCPCCGEADYMVFRVIDSEAAMKKGATCKHCGRGFKSLFKHNGPGNTQFEVVQTVGGELPPYLPKMRRVE